MKLSYIAAALLTFGAVSAQAADPNCNELSFSPTAWTSCGGFVDSTTLKSGDPFLLAWVNSLNLINDSSTPDFTASQMHKDSAGDAAYTDGILATNLGMGSGSVTFQQAYTSPFVLVVKIGDWTAAYRFESVAAGATLSYTDLAPFSFANAASGVSGGSLSHAVAFGSPVPENSTYAMMLVGLAGMGFMSRRRKV